MKSDTHSLKFGVFIRILGRLCVGRVRQRSPTLVSVTAHSGRCSNTKPVLLLERKKNHTRKNKRTEFEV